MGIAIEKSFSVDASPDSVWDFLTDPYKVAKCLPGAAITGQIDDQTYAGTITVKVGPVSSSYKGKIRFDRLVPEERIAELTGRGQDIRGKGGADMKMTSRLTPAAGGGTDATVVSEVNVTGILAQFGRGMIQDVSDQMFETFTKNMRAELESQDAAAAPATDESETASPGETAGESEPEPEAAFDAVAFGAQVGKRTVGRWLRSPGFWIAVLILVAILYFVVL